jgi:hypothetical protein
VRRHLRGDLAGLLNSMALAEGAVAASPTQRAHAVEKSAGWVYARKADEGEVDSRRIARARRGSLVLQAKSRNRLQACLPCISVATCPLLWELVRGRALAIDDAMATLSDQAFWCLHDAAIRWRVFGRPKAPLTDDDLAQLALQGTYEAVAVLWLLVTGAPSSGWPGGDKIHIARYLPPALAVLSSRPSAARVAYVLFARIRQLTLDDLFGEQGWLWLATYDLREAARSFPGAWVGRIGSGPEWQAGIKAARMGWLLHHLAPFTGCPWRFGRLWQEGLSPRERLSGDRVGLAPEAVVLMRVALGAYLG